MRVVPLTLKQANDLVAQLHRHHKPVQGHRFSIGAEVNGVLCGAAVVGRPQARMTDQYRTVEVLRLVTDGTKNACSFLYGASARVAREMGFDTIQTFILESEPGTSLRATGWKFDGYSAGGTWNRPSRGNRRDDQPQEPKSRYVRVFANSAETIPATEDRPQRTALLGPGSQYEPVVMTEEEALAELADIL